ncbi:MAG TPA: M24 family metallopeptidase [Bacteroidota bacterium]|nr:M24 family metallopeptidase [Candidatus Kapabacteria bacterium]HRS01114.1 M24 family metallopeptidase [Bacteroidota bacterium]
MELERIQSALRQGNLDGWLFYDHHNRDAIAARILGRDRSKMATRRWYYFIPANGTPIKLVHKIEQGQLDGLPGEKLVYLPWQEQHSQLKKMLSNSKRIAMQYSPNNNIPYVSIVDGGTLELIRSFGVEVVTSANLVSEFESYIDEEGMQTHIKAGEVMQMVKDEAFKEIRRRLDKGINPTEYEIQQYMVDIIHNNGLEYDDPPIVAVNEHAADPHFEPQKEGSSIMKEGDLVLLDLWAKLQQPRSIYYDITWMGYIGNNIPEKINNIFHIATGARDAALSLVKEKFAKNEPLRGCDLDDYTRKYIADRGYGDAFIHRTGHNIGEEVHGNGTHIDNLETCDDRFIIKGSCFSIEPGIYLPDEKLGFRTEIDVFIDKNGGVHVFGPIQQEIVKI